MRGQLATNLSAYYRTVMQCTCASFAAAAEETELCEEGVCTGMAPAYIISDLVPKKRGRSQ
jgi:hypothetical protein